MSLAGIYYARNVALDRECLMPRDGLTQILLDPEKRETPGAVIYSKSIDLLDYSDTQTRISLCSVLIS